MRLLLPVGRSGWAIAAGYAALFALLLIPAPLALLLGIVALIHLRKNSNLYGYGRAIFAIIVGSVGTFVLLTALLAN